MNELEKRVIEQYNTHAEEQRLFLDNAHKTEFLVTMHYLHNLLTPGMKILDIGAGTGVYSHALASEGYEVDAIDLVPRNIEIIKQNITPAQKLNAFIGNAKDLSWINDNTYDMVLLLGPIYHLHDFNERVLALREAIRVAKPGAPILIAFCLQDAPLIIYMFQSENPAEAINTIGYDHEHAIITNNTGSTIKPDTISAVNHLIDEICKICPVTKGKRFAQDGLSHIIRDAVNSMSDESFATWMQYLIASAEKEELMGIPIMLFKF